MKVNMFNVVPDGADTRTQCRYLVAIRTGRPGVTVSKWLT
jgi:hypothetical protein